ncbi:glycosyltransferase family 2 protein [Crenothrix sp.]|uniref:glycosyltransferase family 2 protein n=1 Tax=Crenothrix sp. TaxID=3100433 RepID=UPI00374D57C3
MDDKTLVTFDANEKGWIEISAPSRFAEKPVVSVSMITYNHKNYIEEAINGVLMQETDFEVELVISNDNSPDQTDAIIQRILKEHPKSHWIKYIKHEKNIGMMPNLIDNLQRCTGEYIAICEGDDYWTDPLKLQFQIDEMKKNPNCDLCFHPAEIISGLLKTANITAFHSTENKIFTASEIITGDGGFCPSPSLLIKKTIISPIPDFLNNAPVGDYFLQILGAINGGALYLSKVMSAYRININESWTSSISDISKKRQFFDKFIPSLNDLNFFLKRAYQEEIYFMLDQQYYYMSLDYLDSKLYEEHDKLFKEYFTKYSKIHLRMRVLYVIGLSIKSSSISYKLDNIVFNVFNETPFIIRLYRKIKKYIIT